MLDYFRGDKMKGEVYVFILLHGCVEVDIFHVYRGRYFRWCAVAVHNNSRAYMWWEVLLILVI